MSDSPPPSIIPPHWHLPDAITERLGCGSGPQRAMREEGHLLLILHQIPLPDERRRKPALFWRHPSGQWESSLDDTGVKSLWKLMHDYETTLEALDDAEDDAKSALEFHNVLEALTPVLRATRGLHRATQQARDLIKADRDLIILRDKSADIERSAELLMQDAQFGLNFTAAKQAESQAESARFMATTAHRLNVLAAWFFPLTALASVFGMQLKHGWEESGIAFWIVLALGIAAGVVMSRMIVRK
jgi:Mg2+ and Co2+ transporter CorA